MVALLHQLASDVEVAAAALEQQDGAVVKVKLLAQQHRHVVVERAAQVGPSEELQRLLAFARFEVEVEECLRHRAHHRRRGAAAALEVSLTEARAPHFGSKRKSRITLSGGGAGGSRAAH